MGGMSGPVAYISQFYPHLTETFVYREVLGLRARGVDVRTFACWSPDLSKLSAEALPLVEETTYVFPLARGRFVLNHLKWLVRRPLRYLGTLLLVTLRSEDTLKNRGFALLHFAMAVHLASEVERQGIRHVHAQFAINAATIALVLSRLLDIRFSFTAHNLLFTKRMVLDQKLQRARFVVAISEFTRRFVVETAPAGGSLAERVHIVHCGLPLQQFPLRERTPRNAVPEVLFVAQLQERKGTPVLVDACRLLAERGIQFHCTIVGGGPFLQPVREQVDSLGLEGIVELTGPMPQERLPSLFQGADIFTIPCVTASDGDMDGIPVALMEAMAMGIATVSTRVSGIPELIEDGVSGLLVNERDSYALADALERLIVDPALRTRLGAAGHSVIERDFDVERTTAELAELFARYGERDR